MTVLKQCQNRQEWDDYILENGGHPLQLWGWGELKADHNWKVDRLFMFDEDRIVGAAQLLIRRLPWPLRSLAYIPRGPVVDDNNRDKMLSDLAEYVKKTYHSVTLTIEPDSEEFIVPEGWKKSLVNHILPARTIILDITKSESELLVDMAKKTRQYIRKSAAGAIVIKKVRSKAELDKCLNIYKTTAKRAKFNLHAKQYYHDVFSKLGDNSPLFAAYVDDQPIAFLWLVISADTAFELYGGMNDLGQQLRANYALKWHAILKCKEWGLSRYDFGGLLEGGVTTFKMGWAEKETELAGTFDRPLSSSYFLWNSGFQTAKKVVRKIKSPFGKH